MKIKEVPILWRMNRKAKTATNSFSTDGSNIYSYRLKIGYTNEYGQKVLLRYTKEYNNFKSHTTSRHVNLAAYHADIFEIPS
jgi:hypothetical protein